MVTQRIVVDVEDTRDPVSGYPTIGVQAIHASRRHVSAKVRVMVDLLAEEFQATPPWDRPESARAG